MFKALRWEDWMGIVLGAWMLVSPWVLGYSDSNAATLNALVMGTILVLEELLEAEAREEMEEWIDLFAGLWLIASPVILGFESLLAPTINAVAVGLATMLFAGWAMSPFDRKMVKWWHEHIVGH